MLKAEYGFQSEMDREFPRMVHIETNNICNLKCIHCPQQDIVRLVPGYAPVSMSWVIFKRIVDEVSQHDSILRFTNDGEPLIHADIVKQINYVQDKKIRTFAFNTNGFFLEDNVLESLLRDSDTKIAVEVSLNALFKDTYSAIEVGSNYNKVMRNIFNFVYTRDKRNLRNKKIMVSIIDQPEVAKEIKTFKRFFGQVVDRVIMRNYVDTKGLLKSKNQKYSEKVERWPCVLPFTRIVVGCDGRVRFCPDDWKKESVIGDITKQSISEIWHSVEFDKLRKEHLKIVKDKASLENRVPCNYCKEWQVIHWDYDYLYALNKLFS